MTHFSFEIVPSGLFTKNQSQITLNNNEYCTVSHYQGMMLGIFSSTIYIKVNNILYSTYGNNDNETDQITQHLINNGFTEHILKPIYNSSQVWGMCAKDNPRPSRYQ